MTAGGAFPIDGPGAPLPVPLDDDYSLKALHLKLDYLVEAAGRAEALANTIGGLVESLGNASGPQAALLKMFIPGGLKL